MLSGVDVVFFAAINKKTWMGLVGWLVHISTATGCHEINETFIVPTG